jgi:hypothetical protein
MKMAITTIDMTPTPAATKYMLEMIINGSTDIDSVNWAKSEMIRCFPKTDQDKLTELYSRRAMTTGHNKRARIQAKIDALENADIPATKKMRDLKKGEFFKRKANANKVYTRGDYCRYSKKYIGNDETDISREILIAGDKLVVVDFEY